MLHFIDEELSVKQCINFIVYIQKEKYFKTASAVQSYPTVQK